jgi:hypothetical protein
MTGKKSWIQSWGIPTINKMLDRAESGAGWHDGQEEQDGNGSQYIVRYIRELATAHSFPYYKT